MASQEQLEEHYNRHFFRTEEDAEAAGVGGDEDHEMEAVSYTHLRAHET